MKIVQRQFSPPAEKSPEQSLIIRHAAVSSNTRARAGSCRLPTRVSCYCVHNIMI